MARKLSLLPPAELLARVRDADLDQGEVLEVLRNPYCSLEIALLIAESPQWTAAPGVRELLAGFRGYPFARVMDLLPTLPWVSLLQLAQTPRTPPVVQRQAEKKILDRLERMALGEKIALARRAHRPLFKPLLETADERVLTALLDNPRLVENDVVLMVNTTRPGLAFFQVLARHSRWGQVYGVRRAIAECERAPLPVALSAMVSLGVGDLRRIAGRPDLPEPVRHAALALARRKTAPRTTRPEPGPSGDQDADA